MKGLLWEQDYISEDDFILEENIIIDKDEIETEIEFNFDIEKVLDESETELRVIPKLILEDIEFYQHKINNLFLKLGGRLL